MSAAPHKPRLLPAENPALGAQTLGCAWGQQEGQEDRAWAVEFLKGREALKVRLLLACLPCLAAPAPFDFV